MGFTGEEKLGSVARLWRERGSRRLGCGLPIGQGVHRRKSRCRDRNLNKQLFAQTAPPPLRGRGTGRGADAPAATLGAYLCAVRTMLQHRSYPALQATERGSSRGNLSPLTVFWFLLYAQKERLRGERCLLCLCKRLRAADRRLQI